jgi:hypothetical protein
MLYSQKLIISGNCVELYNYSKPIKHNYVNNKKEKPKIQTELYLGNEKIFYNKRDDVLSRTRSNIRRLINSNPDFSKFTTLTFKENLTNITQANNHFNKFIKRLKYQYSDNLKYLAVIEFQKRGAVHYHMLNNLSYVPADVYATTWGNGFVNLKNINKISNVGAYVCKYLTKDSFDGNMKNRKKFFHSRNLNEPQTFIEQKTIDDLIKFYDLSSVKPVYKCQFDNDYIGAVEYKQYSLALCLN